MNNEEEGSKRQIEDQTIDEGLIIKKRRSSVFKFLNILI